MLHLIGLQSEEDLALKQQLELYVERAQDSEEGIQRTALEAMRCILQCTICRVVSVVVILPFVRYPAGSSSSREGMPCSAWQPRMSPIF